MLQQLRGPLAPESDRGTALPFVLTVGNHSSGKSSFINYVLGRKIQTTGVAPTDDAFTIIAPGPSDRDQDGPALSTSSSLLLMRCLPVCYFRARASHLCHGCCLSHKTCCFVSWSCVAIITIIVGDPDLGFQQLRQFGPTLMHHTALKIRSNIDSNFIMVDSPGMIDSPGSTQGMLGGDTSSSNNNKEEEPLLDRGYDFTGVVRWMAQRADIVCLFFDPDKPGTTGEALSILLHALSGMDHKLLIILNKADQFQKIHDFARAYGSLCWNLSKVIPRKDLPRIYTMCLPIATTTAAKDDETMTTKIPSALQDLHAARDEVVAEVRKAPARRMDNVITHLYDSVRQLQMHSRILQDLKERWSRLYWQSKWQQISVVAAGGALTTLLTYYGSVVVPVPVTGGVLATTIVAVGGMTWYHRTQLYEWEQQACTVEELSAAFQRTHAREISQGDEYTAALWQRVRDPLRVALQQQPLSQTATVSASEMASLQAILDVDIPALRRLVSPTHYGKDESSGRQQEQQNER